MKPWQFYLSTTLAGLTLLLTIALLVITTSNRTLERGLQDQQVNINRGQMSQQVGTAVVKDLAQLSISNSKIKDLLAKHGITVNQNEPAN
jgi:signal transduction histidine kinase